jgi:hypothetical protein
MDVSCCPSIGELDMKVEGRLVGGDEEPQSFKSRNSALPLSAQALGRSLGRERHERTTPNFH